ncbi:hypothetical protein [Amycolatopsis taiwanensis]|uniref:Uncharacterized protein n=1 Tax=Amycolatopsis taiwanensis TaxID=342230 RepID=A0A9W6R1R5_9PSEU|nr:hypothetical protein [Amycolatopsis taiwanensis]GLY66795.1 hypothetical protein Atai01_34140 [Amycolatopsis taiwanensis]
MSAHAIIVAELSARPDVAAARAAEVADWLLDRGIIELNRQRDTLRRPSEYNAGPFVSHVAPGFQLAASLADNGVDVIPERQVHHAGGNYREPECPGCGTALNTRRHMELIDLWLAGTEPAVACNQCGIRNLAGDWRGDFGVHVANLVVQFNNWPPLTDRFVGELRERLGPRPRLIYRHI